MKVIIFSFDSYNKVICQNERKYKQVRRCVKIGNFKISRLLFADDLVLLADSESGLLRARDGFAAACDYVGMKISIAKTEVLHISKKSVQCSLQVSGVKLKQM